MFSLLEILAFCLAIGAIAGLLAGLFGIGGGLVLVPFLAWLYSSLEFNPDLTMVMAVATSLATIIVTSVSSVTAHHRLNAVNWPTVVQLVPGIVLGSVLGSLFADRLAADQLRSLFAFFLLYVAFQMAFQITPARGIVRPSGGLLVAAGTFIGALSTTLGIGGGTLTVPFLVASNYSIRNAVANSSACGLPIALSGTATYVVLGWGNAQLPNWSLGYIYLPAFFGIIAGSISFAQLGARLAHSLPTRRLKRLFALVVLGVALKMFW